MATKETQDKLPVRRVAKAIIIDPVGGVALVLRLEPIERQVRGIDEWHVPGGSFDEQHDSTLLDTLWREVQEETGFTDQNLVLIDELGTDEWQALYKREPSRFRATFFLLKVAGPMPANLQLSDESEDYHWLTEAEAAEFPNLTPEARRFIASGFGLLRELPA